METLSCLASKKDWIFFSSRCSLFFPSSFHTDHWLLCPVWPISRVSLAYQCHLVNVNTNEAKLRNKASAIVLYREQSGIFFISPSICLIHWCGDVVMWWWGRYLGLAAASIHQIIVVKLARVLLCNYNCREIRKTDKAAVPQSSAVSRCCIPRCFSD